MTLDSWNTLFQFTSAALLALTFFVGAGAVITGYRLNRRQAEKMASVDRDVAEANKRAAEAGQGTAKALQDAAHAEERAGRLELEAAAQREKAALAEKNLLELQQRLAPRRFSEGQRATFTDALKAGPKVPLVLIASISDQEAVDWANQIHALLTNAGWTISSNGVGPFSGTGVVIATKTRDLSSAATHLIRAFASVGVGTGHEIDAEQSYELRLMILSKPGR